MIVTNDNINKLPTKEQNLIKSLLEDLKEINNVEGHPEIFLNWIDEHTVWSPERVDPCPDYYGLYTLIMDNKRIGIEMDLETLDYCLCLLHNFLI